MLDSKTIKEAARRMGADLVGIGDLSLFDGTDPRCDPRNIAPRAKAIIGLGFRQLRGSLRGLEEGTQFYQYPEMGIVHIEEVYAPSVLRDLCCFIEDHGYEGVPLRSTADRKHPEDTVARPERSSVSTIAYAEPVAEGKPAPDVLPDFVQAACICGLGEIGRGGFVLTPEFGPLQRFAFILTNAPLETDSPFTSERVCDDCGKCIEVCPGSAISATESQSRAIAGTEVTTAKVDCKQCALYYLGAEAATNPFLDDETRKEFSKPINVNALDDAEYQRLRSMLMRAYGGVRFGYTSSICGRACYRACLSHLEETGRLKKKFIEPFRTEEQWKIDAK